MASPTVYSWQDASAPQIQIGNTTDYLNLFQKVLVDGYGVKAPAGWSIPFTDASGFIIKQGGTGSIKACLKMYNFEAVGYSCQMEASDDYVDYTTPVGQFDGFLANDRLGVGYASATFNIPWMIFATETSLYMIFGYNTNQIDSPLFDNIASTTFDAYHSYFGNYVPSDPSQTRKQLCMHSYYSASTSQRDRYFTQAVTAANSDESSKHINSGAGGLAGSFEMSFMTLRSQKATTAYNIGNDQHQIGGISYPNPSDGALYLDSPKLTSFNSIIGGLPSLLYSPSTSAFPITKSIYTISGSGDYTGSLIYVINTYNDGQFYIHDGEWGVE